MVAFIVIVIVVVVLVLVIMAAYGRSKHKARQVFMPIDPNNPDFDHKYMEIRATADQFGEFLEEQRSEGWAYDDMQIKPGSGIFGSHMHLVTFHKMTREERDAYARKKAAKAAGGQSRPTDK